MVQDFLINSTQTPRGIQKLDPLEPYGISYKEYIGVIMGLYRGSNFSQGSGYVVSSARVDIRKRSRRMLFQAWLADTDHGMI